MWLIGLLWNGLSKVVIGIMENEEVCRIFNGGKKLLCYVFVIIVFYVGEENWIIWF